ncbi:hypothetical protein CAPTEDRAFT_105330, partial [Capitella teleta]
NGWCPGNADNSKWIEIDLMENKFIGAIITMGCKDDSDDEYVKTFRIKYRVDGSAWADYTDDDGSVMIFEGNQNKFQSVLNDFKENIYARHVRLYPLTHNDYATLRWELLGCTKCE